MDINLDLIETNENKAKKNNIMNMKIDKRCEVLEYVARKMFLLNACITVISVAAITFFVFSKDYNLSLQAMQKEHIA